MLILLEKLPDRIRRLGNIVLRHLGEMKLTREDAIAKRSAGLGGRGNIINGTVNLSGNFPTLQMCFRGQGRGVPTEPIISENEN